MITTPGVNTAADQARMLAQGSFDRFWEEHGPAVRNEAYRLGIPVDQLLNRRFLRVTGKAGLVGLADLPDLIVARDISIDRGAWTCEYLGVQFDLTATEYDIVSLLAGNAGLVLSCDFFAAQLWGAAAVYTKTFTVHINRLRAKLGMGPDDGPLVTVPRQGYRWIG